MAYEYFITIEGVMNGADTIIVIAHALNDVYDVTKAIIACGGKVSIVRERMT